MSPAPLALVRHDSRCETWKRKCGPRISSVLMASLDYWPPWRTGDKMQRPGEGECLTRRTIAPCMMPETGTVISEKHLRTSSSTATSPISLSTEQPSASRFLITSWDRSSSYPLRHMTARCLAPPVLAMWRARLPHTPLSPPTRRYDSRGLRELESFRRLRRTWQQSEFLCF